MRVAICHGYSILQTSVLPRTVGQANSLPSSLELSLFLYAEIQSVGVRPANVKILLRRGHYTWRLAPVLRMPLTTMLLAIGPLVT